MVQILEKIGLHFSKIYRIRAKLAHPVILHLIRFFCLLEKVSTYSEPSHVRSAKITGHSEGVARGTKVYPAFHFDITTDDANLSIPRVNQIFVFCFLPFSSDVIHFLALFSLCSHQYLIVSPHTAL